MILALDQGTTSSRAIVFDEYLKPIAKAQKELKQYFPENGWVEHDAREIWKSVLSLMKKAAKGHKIRAIGVTNQRETIVLWDKVTGEPLHNAIVWQDRRTSDFCKSLKPHEAMIKAKTGLTLDPYFSASKLKWLLDHVPQKHNLMAGTIDSYLLFKLTGEHKTDATNASRTMLYNIHTGDWDNELLTLFGIPRDILPSIHDNAYEFGVTYVLGYPVPILGMAGDQQAALIGQGCFEAGMVKSTYGTGCFALMNTGLEPLSRDNILTTVAYQFNGKRTYALEGSVYIAGAGVQWLRDEMKMLKKANEADALALKADSHSQVIMIPAFTGLGAPYWNSEVRGAIFGLTRNSGAAEITKATLQSVGFQTRDLMEAMGSVTTLRVDGGMTASNYTMQFLADILGAKIEVSSFAETTVLGAAYLAGLQLGIYKKPAEFMKIWGFSKVYMPVIPSDEREKLFIQWKKAVAKLLD